MRVSHPFWSFCKTQPLSLSFPFTFTWQPLPAPRCGHCGGANPLTSPSKKKKYHLYPTHVPFQQVFQRHKLASSDASVARHKSGQLQASLRLRTSRPWSHCGILSNFNPFEAFTPDGLVAPKIVRTSDMKRYERLLGVQVKNCKIHLAFHTFTIHPGPSLWILRPNPRG